MIHVFPYLVIHFRDDEPAVSLSTVKTVDDVNQLEDSKPWLRKLLLAVPLLLACFCFWQALPSSVTTPQTVQAVTAKSQSARQLVTRRIDEIQPGHRVLADNPIASDTHRDAAEPNSISDRLIKFRMPKADGSFVDISLIRPVRWIEAEGVHQGATINLDYPEFGAVGPAEVITILPCPAIEPGAGEVVTGRFTHSTGDILDIQIKGESNPIGTTGNHPWWSEDRQEFVEASELQPGETLRTASGKFTQIISITPRTNAETVYNLEVNREHVYYVGESGLLVHNSYQMHHTIPRAIQKNLPARIRRHIDIRGRRGLPNRIPVEYYKHRRIHSGRGLPQKGGYYNNRFQEEIDKIPRELLDADDILRIRDMLVIEFAL